MALTWELVGARVLSLPGRCTINLSKRSCDWPERWIGKVKKELLAGC
jgi:hypothetical protein